MKNKLDVVSGLIQQIQTSEDSLINYVVQVPKLFGMYLGDLSCVTLCDINFCEISLRDIGNIKGFWLLVKVPIVSSETDHTLVRLHLRARGTTDGAVTLERMQLIGESRSTRHSSDGVCIFLFNYLVDIVNHQVCGEMRSIVGG